MQIRRLQSCYTKNQIQEALRTIPESLEAAYEETLNKIPSKDAKIARLILIWLSSSFRPMTINEIAAAVDLPHPEFVLKICTSMLVTLIHEQTDVFIKLAHFSVKEYLVTRYEGNGDEDSHSYRFSSELAHATIGSATISYILDTNSVDLPELTNLERPLLSYSADYWFQHVAAVGELIDEFPRLSSQLANFFSPEYIKSYLNWLEIYDWDENEHGGEPYNPNLEESSRYPHPVHCASLFGFGRIVKLLLARNEAIWTQTYILENACVGAAINGHSQIVQDLLSDRRCQLQQHHIIRIVRGVNTNTNAIVKVLWEAGIFNPFTGNLTENDSDSFVDDWVLETAIGSWKNALEVTKALLDRLGSRALISSRVVLAAARNSLSGGEVIRLLLDRYPADVIVTNQVLQAAAGNGMNGVEVMTLLLDWKRSSVHVTKEVVQEAAKNTKSGKRVLSLLFNQLEEPTTQDPQGVLEVLVENFDDDLTELFLDRNAHVQVTEEVLKAAKKNVKHHAAIMKLLIGRRSADDQSLEDMLRAAEKGKSEGSQATGAAFTPRGKLVVNVRGARRLRKRKDIYLVIVFQQNEFISKILPNQEQDCEEVLIPVPSRRSYSDAGRRRQDSVVGLADEEDLDAEEFQSSEPLSWDVSAVL